MTITLNIDVNLVLKNPSAKPGPGNVQFWFKKQGTFPENITLDKSGNIDIYKVENNAEVTVVFHLITRKLMHNTVAYEMRFKPSQSNDASELLWISPNPGKPTAMWSHGKAFRDFLSKNDDSQGTSSVQVTIDKSKLAPTSYGYDLAVNAARPSEDAGTLVRHDPQIRNGSPTNLRIYVSVGIAVAVLFVLAIFLMR